MPTRRKTGKFLGNDGPLGEGNERGSKLRRGGGGEGGKGGKRERKDKLHFTHVLEHNWNN